MDDVVEKMNCTAHQGQSYIIKVMKTVSLITCSMNHICSMSITTEQNLRYVLQVACGDLSGMTGHHVQPEVHAFRLQTVACHL